MKHNLTIFIFLCKCSFLLLFTSSVLFCSIAALFKLHVYSSGKIVLILLVSTTIPMPYSKFFIFNHAPPCTSWYLCLHIPQDSQTQKFETKLILLLSTSSLLPLKPIPSLEYLILVKGMPSIQLLRLETSDSSASSLLQHLLVRVAFRSPLWSVVGLCLLPIIPATVFIEAWLSSHWQFISFKMHTTAYVLTLPTSGCIFELLLARQ